MLNTWTLFSCPQLSIYRYIFSLINHSLTMTTYLHWGIMGIHKQHLVLSHPYRKQYYIIDFFTIRKWLTRNHITTSLYIWLYNLKTAHVLGSACILIKGSLTLAMGKCLWFSVKIKACQSSLSSPWSYPGLSTLWLWNPFSIWNASKM